MKPANITQTSCSSHYLKNLYINSADMNNGDFDLNIFIGCKRK